MREEGGGCFLERGACLTFWPWGLVLSQGRALLEHRGLFERGGRFTGEGYLFDILAFRGWVPFQERVLLEL